jgi:bifunctional DNA-binding transcriptional regulator/antitoxin component of YhaV-PrlF toxin-antitoxin module
MVWQMVLFPIMNTLVTMDKSGRLVLPGRIRKALQVSPPAAFKAEVMGNKVELTLIPARSGAVLKKRRGLLVVSTGGRKFNAVEAVNVAREERR